MGLSIGSYLLHGSYFGSFLSVSLEKRWTFLYGRGLNRLTNVTVPNSSDSYSIMYLIFLCIFTCTHTHTSSEIGNWLGL